MKKNKKESIKLDQSVKVSFQILSFGQKNFSYTIRGEDVEEKKHFPTYIVPLTTGY